jgi:hypothetical protein
METAPSRPSPFARRRADILHLAPLRAARRTPIFYTSPQRFYGFLLRHVDTQQDFV